MIIAGKYQVISELGRGGMGTVYRVRHLELGASFALKILHPPGSDEADLVGRFYHEARIMAQLRHPNIVKVFDMGQDGDSYYFVMEYVQGRNLNQILKQEGPLPLDRVLAISRQIGQALAYAHNQHPPVIHRDIKPHNILIEDDTARVVVMDFGIAKLLGSQQTQHTRTGLFIGTLAYGAPEQLRSDITIDNRADIFSLGLVMYEMMAGRRFFAGLTQEEIIGKQLYDPGEYLLSFERPVPSPLRRLVAKAMAKNRDRRYTQVAELLATLARIEDRRGGMGGHPPRWLLMLSGGVALAGLVAFLSASDAPRWQPVLAEFVNWIAELTRPVESGPAIKPTGFPRPVEPPVPPVTPIHTPPVEPASLPAAPAKLPEPVSTEQAVQAVETVQTVETVSVARVHPPTSSTARSPLQATPAARRIVLKVCETQIFEVSDPAQGYAWWVDGQRQSEEGARFRFSTPQSGEHEVRVVALDDEATPLTWEVLTVPAPPSEAEVRQWLAEYQRALESRDFNRLRALGYLRSDRQLEALREKLRSRQGYQTQIQDWQAEVQVGEVRLSFEQADHWRDETSRSLVVDYSTQNVTLARQDCTQIVAR